MADAGIDAITHHHDGGMFLEVLGGNHRGSIGPGCPDNKITFAC
ncbi:hypothetical protein CBE74_12380 [Corynebacterium silvaticum]|uniref:Uncharacterized protein n=1 Tax=Corynebacterium silvaticum TaxID=2320431 RepID=A0ACD4PYS1_9CORY|nr:hypothetical protein [Corynebacterium silvaticum]WCV10758.1 hypothetical protein CBE74_12380 [Corynebacterium silvaticum]